MNLPIGALDIAQARDNGMRPRDPVIVSLVGRVNEPNPQVLVTRADHDWRFLAGLEVLVYLRRGADHAKATLRGLAGYAARISVWDVDAKRGIESKPVWRLTAGVLKGHEYAGAPLAKPAKFSRWESTSWPAYWNEWFA